MPKAKKVTPPTDMDAHNAARQDEDGGDEQEAEADVATLTTAEVAEQIGTTPRTLRKFLRSKQSGVDPVGQGKRYAFTDHSVPKLASKFEVWKAKDEAERKAKSSSDDEIDEITNEVEEIEEMSYSVEELEEFSVAELRELIHDSMGADSLPPKKTPKRKLIALLTN